MAHQAEQGDDSSLGEPGSPPSTDVSFELTSSSEACSSATSDSVGKKGYRYSRSNSQAEKRKMRISRKRRKRALHSGVAAVQEDLKHAQALAEKKEHTVRVYRHMSRTYWERWHWELQKRREAMTELRMQHNSSTVKERIHVHQIEPSTISDCVIDGEPREVYIGRGCFGIVRLQSYRGICVAVKELLPQTVLADVMHEARILSLLCHPNLPYLFGVCTSDVPLRIVMQFHGVNVGSQIKSTCLWEEIRSKTPTIKKQDPTWITLCAELFEAMRYLHDEVDVLHNDISPNILLSENSSVQPNCRIVLIDFGKATLKSKPKAYQLTESEKVEYTRKYPYMAPEVVSGEACTSCNSDMFSAGGILYNLLEFGILPTECKTQVQNLAEQCRSVHYHKRPSASQALSVLQNLLN